MVAVVVKCCHRNLQLVHFPKHLQPQSLNLLSRFSEPSANQRWRLKVLSAGVQVSCAQHVLKAASSVAVLAQAVEAPQVTALLQSTTEEP